MITYQDYEEIFEGEEYNVMGMFLRKGIPNKAVGKCGKQRNKKIISTLFKNKDDANMITPPNLSCSTDVSLSTKHISLK